MIDFDNIEKLIWAKKPQKKAPQKPTKITKKTPHKERACHTRQH